MMSIEYAVMVSGVDNGGITAIFFPPNPNVTAGDTVVSATVISAGSGSVLVGSDLTHAFNSVPVQVISSPFPSNLGPILPYNFPPNSPFLLQSPGDHITG